MNNANNISKTIRQDKKYLSLSYFGKMKTAGLVVTRVGHELSPANRN